jgi:dihydrofolate reductase
MIISIIAAVDENGGIGFKNQIPWHLPADLARFKVLTMGHFLLLGRKTYQSIGSALPGRQMIILTRNLEFEAPDCITTESLNEALEMAETAGEDEVFIIGGAEIYLEALPLADRLYLTRVHSGFEVDVYFPVIDNEDWDLVVEEFYPPDEKNLIPHTYYQYHRVTDQESAFNPL